MHLFHDAARSCWSWEAGGILRLLASQFVASGEHSLRDVAFWMRRLEEYRDALVAGTAPDDLREYTRALSGGDPDSGRPVSFHKDGLLYGDDVLMVPAKELLRAAWMYLQKIDEVTDQRPMTPNRKRAEKRRLDEIFDRLFKSLNDSMKEILLESREMSASHPKGPGSTNQKAHNKARLLEAVEHLRGKVPDLSEEDAAVIAGRIEKLLTGAETNDKRWTRRALVHAYKMLLKEREALMPKTFKPPC